MIVVMHRPIYRRIEIGARTPVPAVIEVESELGKAIRAAAALEERLEYERIWRCVERASQGQGSQGNDKQEPVF